MEEFDQKDRHNLLRQLAILEVAKRAEGKRTPEIRAMLRDAFAERGAPEGPDGWMNAVATAAAGGEPYIISQEAAAAAAEELNPRPKPPRQVRQAAPKPLPGPLDRKGRRSAGGTSAPDRRAQAVRNPVLLALAWLPAKIATAAVRVAAVIMTKLRTSGRRAGRP